MKNVNLAKLKVKVKSLAEEARIIRKEEAKFNGSDEDRESLRRHRVWDVANEARASQLAVACLKGSPYSRAEQSIRLDKVYVFTYKIRPRIIAMVKKYSRHSEYRKIQADYGTIEKYVDEWLDT